MKSIATLLAAVFFSTTLFAQLPADVQQALQRISPEAIKAHMSFLADDLLEGRKPGTRGFALAANYMRTQLQASGLKPGVYDSSYIQPVPLQKGWADTTASRFVLHGANDEVLQLGKDVVLNPYFGNEVSSVTAPMVFVGYGISAPEFKYDDYKKLDVRGKIVVYVADAPAGIPTSERAYYTSADVKYAEAIRRGAVGAISFSLPTNKRASWDAIARRSKQGAYKWIGPNGAAANSYPELKAVAVFNNAFVEKLFIRSKTSLQNVYDQAAAGKLTSFPLNISATIDVKTTTETVAGANVVSVLEGSDPVLKNEYVVYTAHLDHFGIGAPVKGDSIYNGAHDDASGNAILLEVARAYKQLAPPKRSVIFASVTGEELGLLGSDYFVNNFPIAGGKIVANLAIDMPFFFHPVLDIVPYGADHSSLGVQNAKAASLLGLSISPDPFPEQVVFIRSDHYSFIKKGIPALFIKSGFKTVPQDTVDRAKSDVGWRSSIYHTPQDDMSQPFDFNGAAMHVKINFLTGYFTATETAAPSWNAGDFFGNKFKKPL